MKYSKFWLQEFINFDISTEKLAEQLTMAGLEVDNIQPVAPKFHGVVVGEILEVNPHPNADKLTVCKVDIGTGEILNIVCGAPNVKPKLKVPVALIGAELPNNLKIKKVKLRNVDSSGMLCSAIELGLATDSLGIFELADDAPVGVDIREYLILDDEILEVELTSNRGDCLSMIGLARELVAITRTQLLQLETKQFTNTKDIYPIKVLAEDACPHYCGRIIRGVNNKVKTPLWMQERLRHLGIQPVNLIVDITNYVMLELGQPLHAFDLSTLDKQIEVRYAKSGEEIRLLDGREIKLNSDTLVIADANKPLAIGGVMGGSDTGISLSTTDIFLESAFFVPEKIAQEIRSYNIQTDSSYRFERGVDYDLQLKALNRATSLIADIAGGIPGGVSEVVSKKHLPKFSDVILHRNAIKSVIGINVPDKDVESILSHLGMMLKSTPDEWQVSIPSFRFDLKIEEDLIEEIARSYGYHLIPEQKIVTSLENATAGIDTDLSFRRRLYAFMQDRGYREIITYSFVEEKLQKMLSAAAEPLFLANPISLEQSVMRSTLWPGLLNTIKYNLEHQKQHVRFFEVGLVFLQEKSDLEQRIVIAGATCGNLYKEQWGIKQKEQADFFDLKNDVEALLKLFSPQQIKYTPKKHSALHPKRSAEIYFNGEPVGFIGELHPIVKQHLGIDKNISLFEVNLQNIIKRLRFNFKAFSKFPSVQRDIAIIVNKDVSWAAIRQKIVDISAELLQNITLFDVYCSENIGLDKRSMAIRMVFQSVNRTLVDAEIELLVNQIILVLKQTFGASLRG